MPPIGTVLYIVSIYAYFVEEVCKVMVQESGGHILIVLNFL